MGLWVREVTSVKLADTTCHTLTHNLNSYDSWNPHTHTLRATLKPESSAPALRTNNTALYHSLEWVHKTGNRGSDFKVMALLWYTIWVHRNQHFPIVFVRFDWKQHCIETVSAWSEYTLRDSTELSGKIWFDFFQLFTLSACCSLNTGVHFPSCFQWKQ